MELSLWVQNCEMETRWTLRYSLSLTCCSAPKSQFQPPELLRHLSQYSYCQVGLTFLALGTKKRVLIDLLIYILLAYKIPKWVLEPARLLSSQHHTFHLSGQGPTQLLVIRAQLPTLREKWFWASETVDSWKHLHMVWDLSYSSRNKQENVMKHYLNNLWTTFQMGVPPPPK